MSNTTGPIRRSGNLKLDNLTISGYLKSPGLSYGGNMFHYNEHHMVDKYINTNGDVSTASGWDSIGVFKVEADTDYAVYDTASGITYILIGAYNSETTNSTTCLDPRVDHTSITGGGYTFKTPTGTTHLVITVDNGSTIVNIPTIMFIEGTENIGTVNHLYKLDDNTENGWISRTKDLHGLIKNHQLTDYDIPRNKLDTNVISTLLSESDKYYIRRDTTPLDGTYSGTTYNNAVIGLYSNTVDMNHGNDELINYYAGGSTDSESLKRVHNSDLDVFYNRPNLIRLSIDYVASGTSIYYPSLVVKITNDDLKKIGIDVSSSGYTTKYVDIRASVGNYVGWVGHQYWVTLCYTHSPDYYSRYTTDDVTYTYASEGDIEPLNSDIASNNTGKTFTVTGETSTEHGFTFRMHHNVPIYKSLYISGDTLELLDFQGILLQVLGSGSNDNSTTTRGFDIHSLAVINRDSYDEITTDMSVKNTPEDVILKYMSLNDLQDVSVPSGTTSGYTLFFSGDTWTSDELTMSKINDVNISDLQHGEQLIYSGDTWVNVPQGSQYMPAEPAGLTKVNNNLFVYPDNHMPDKYIGTTGSIGNASGWDSIGTFEVEADTDYAVYDTASGITYILIGAYNSETTNSTTCLDPRVDHTSITGGYTFKTPTGTTHLVITVDNNTTSVNIPTINLIKGTSNEGDQKTTWRLNKDVEDGWFVRTSDIVGDVMYDQLNSGVTDDMLLDSDKWYLRKYNSKPLDPTTDDTRNAVKNLYSSSEDVLYGSDYTFDFSTLGAVTSSSLKRVFDTDVSTYYNRANVIRLRCEYASSGTSVYYPALVIRADNDDLKTIDVDITSTGYTTQLVDIRISIGNYVGWVGHQLWLTLCYVHYPSYYNHYTTSEVTYTHADSVRHPLDSNIESDNSTMDFSTTGSTEIENNMNFYFFKGVNINKNVIISSTSYQFKGIVIHILGASSNDTSETIRGFDFHSAAIVNRSVYNNINASSDLLNRPEDIVFTRTKLEDLKDVDLSSSPSNGEALIYSSSSKTWKSNTIGNVSKVTIKNSDKIAFYGSSYTESAYAVKNKSWVNKIGQLTDWIVANMGQSGNRLTDEVERLRNNSNPYHSTIGVKDLSPTLISFSNIGNETLDDLENLDMYRQELTYAFQHVKSIGSEMIIGTEHYATKTIETLLYSLSKEMGIDAAPIGTVGNRVLSGDYAGFWGGGHPATRTNAHSFLEWMYFMWQLPRPRKSIKVFRVRSEYKGGSPDITDLSYDTIQQRIRYFQEIGSGENSLSESPNTGWTYYDRLNESYAIVNQTNEYCKLMANEDVIFTGRTLIEVTMDKLYPDTIDIYIKTDTEPDKVYVANNNDPSTRYDENRNGDAFKVTKTVYDSFSETIGENFYSDATGGSTGSTLTYAGKVKGGYLDGYWLFFNSTDTAVSGGSGYLTKTSTSGTTAYIKCDSNLGRHKINLFENWEKPWSRFEETGFTYSYDSETDYITVSITGDTKYYVQYDKIRIIIEKTGQTFNISDIYATYSGGIDKRNVHNPKFEPKKNYIELNDFTGFNSEWTGTTGGWSSSGATLEQIPSSVRDYPPVHDANHHVVLGFDSVSGFSNLIEKTFDFKQDTRGDSRLIIRVIARLFPKIFNTTVNEDDYHTHTRQIKPDSYDMGTLVCALDTDDGEFNIIKKPVDIGWSEVYFDTYIPSSTASHVKLKLYRDEQDKIDTTNYRNHLYPMQIYDVSVQIESGNGKYYNVVDQMSFQIDVESGKTYMLARYNFYDYMINELRANVNTGSTSLTFKIDSTTIGGLNSITVNTGLTSYEVTSDNIANTGTTLSMIVDDVPSLSPTLYGTLKITKSQ